MKAMIILNPHAHSGTTPQQVEAQQGDISAQLKTRLNLDSVEWRETEHAGHGKELAAEATTKDYQYVFAGGGDGTINEVVNGIMTATADKKKRPTLGVIPLGTSNDFFAALKTAEASRKVDPKDNLTLALDIGHVLFDDVERYFCLTVGIGLFSWANEQYLEQAKTFGRRFAHIPAAFTTVMGYRFLPNVSISRNGKQWRARRLYSVIVNNSPVVAGGTPLTPKAKIDDGQFDLCIIKPVSLLQLLWLAVQIRAKAHTHSRAIEMGQIQEIEVTAKEPLPIHVDGELVPELESKARQMKVKILPSALRIVIPSLCEFELKATDVVPVSTVASV